MSKLQSRLMRRRWKSRAYRDRVIPSIRLTVRRSIRPAIKIGTTPDPSTDRPTEVNHFIENRNAECYEVTSCEPVRIKRETVWRIALIDGNDDRLQERYVPLIHGCGLHLYRIYSRPLPTIGGVSVVVFVGVSKGEHE